jgi:UDP-glucose 4-epimerase
MARSNSLRYLITGGAGFIGSHLLDALLSDPATTEVRVLDNFSSGRREHVALHAKDKRLAVKTVDLLDLEKILPHFRNIDRVFHLAANPDARWGIDNTRLDLEQETIATYNVLEAMRRKRVPQIVFSSSGTVYGDVGTTVTHENLGPCLPVSLYGAGKVASEALITAFCATFGLRGIILRFGNIVGERTTHGVIYDFIRQLAKNSGELKVLGNGFQAKPYVYARDLVSGLMFAGQRCSEQEPSKFDVFNVGWRHLGALHRRRAGGTAWIQRSDKNSLRNRRRRLAGRRAAIENGFLKTPQCRLCLAAKFRRRRAPGHQPHPRVAREAQGHERRFKAASRCFDGWLRVESLTRKPKLVGTARPPSVAATAEGGEDGRAGTAR